MAQEAMEPGALPPPTKLNPVKDADGVWRLNRVRHRAFNGEYVRTSGSGRTRKECLADWNGKFERNRRKGSASSGEDRQSLKLGDKLAKAFDAYYKQQQKKCAAGKITEQSLTTYYRTIYKGEGPKAKADAIKLAHTLGRLSISEVGKPAFLADYLEGMAEKWPGIAGHQYVILSGTFKMLTLAGLFDFSPMLPVPRPMSQGGGQRALTAEERDELYVMVSTRQKRSVYLTPLVLLMLGTGMRPGEALAMRWCDVAGLEDEFATVHVCGTIVARKGGCVRQPYRKSGKSSKVSNSFYLTLPRWLTDVLRGWAAKHGHRDDSESMLFVSLKGNIVAPSTAGSALQNARAGTSLEWLQFGNLRDTVATHVTGMTGDPRNASAQLGHSEGASMATRHYIDAGGYTHPAVDNTSALESLCPAKVGPK